MVTDVKSWSDSMIIAIVPQGASTGPIVISNQYGSDSSTNEAQGAWYATGAQIAPDFVVFSPDNPTLQGHTQSRPNNPYGCQDASGTWTFVDYVDGPDWPGFTEQYTFSQTPVPGGYHVTGTADTCGGTIDGTLDYYGDLEFTETDNFSQCGWTHVGRKVRILGTGCNQTSLSYRWYPDNGPWYGDLPPTDWLTDMGHYLWHVEVAGTKQASVPSAETTSFVQWVDFNGNPGGTLGEFKQTLAVDPQSTATNFIGRLVYEQQSSESNDQCSLDGLLALPDSISGGAWYVNNESNSSVWSPDAVGAPPELIAYFRSIWANGCSMTVPQDMLITNSTDNVRYVTNDLEIEITQDQICSSRAGVRECQTY